MAGLAVCGWLLFFSQWAILMLQLSCFIAMVIVLGITAWIGYTMGTTRPPEPIEETKNEPKQSENVSQQNANGSEKQGSS